MERRLVAVLAADMVGYSRLMAADEAGTLTRQKTYRTEVIDPKIAEYGGRLVKSTGDGVLVEFPSVVDALRCAVTIQLAIPEREAAVLEENRIAYRIGINLGDIIVEDDDIYGDGVNVAARLEALAEPGGVSVSRTVVDHVRGKVASGFEDLGEQSVKNIPEPVHVFRVLMLPEEAGEAVVEFSSALWWKRPTAAIAVAGIVLVITAAVIMLWQSWKPDVEPASIEKMAFPLPDKPSIAVVPFENLDGDDATGRLADGIARDIITDLARFRDLDVIARNSTAVYKDKAVEARVVGKDLNVRYVLEGSIQRQLDRVRVTAQLIDATTGTHLWSERWDRPAGDVFAIQTAVAERVASALGGKNLLFSESRAAAKRKRPTDLDAYDLWVLAADALLRASEDDLKQGVAYADAAIAKDPGLVRAYTEKGWLLLNLTKYTKNYREAHLEMERLARTAIEIDPYDAEAQTLLAFATGMLGNNAESMAANTRAVELNPSSADILNIVADSMAYLGQPEASAEMCDRSFRLNPHHPNWYYLDCPAGYFFTGRYQDVIDIMDRYDAVGDLWAGGLIWRAASQAELGGKEAAVATVAELVERYPDVSMEFQVNTGWNFERAQEEQQIVASARKAGVRICATEAELVEFISPNRLEVCVERQQ